MWGQHHVKSTASHSNILITYTLIISTPTEHETLLSMANQCLICLKQCISKAALKNHTGTADSALRKPHVCRKCDRALCSQRAMEQHRYSPTHTTFSCDVCIKQFGSKQAVADHKKSLKHKSMVYRAKLACQAPVSAITSAGNVCLHSVSK